MATRPYDLVIWGGSGFTGRLAAEYLARKYTPGGASSPKAADGGESVRWAIAGRDRRKLEEVRAEIERKHPHVAGKIDVLVGSVDDASSMRAVTSRASTVLSFAGPFARFGMPLVDACVETTTDYCDITGEPNFIRACVDKHDAAARREGIKLVNCVGYDSVPWDLGAWAVARELRDKHGDGCVDAFGHAGAAKGGVSGGTIASALNVLTTTPWDVLKKMGSPFYVANGGGAGLSDETKARWRTQKSYAYDEDVKSYTMPSIMASINTKVVARSASLCAQLCAGDSNPYPPDFAYNESDLSGGYVAAMVGTAMMSAFGAALMFPPSRWLLSKTVLPAPGQGPAETTRETGFANIYVVGKGAKASTPKVCAHMEFKDADPGYKGTAALAVEAALCLALPAERRKNGGAVTGGGVLTPASALGATLVDRLNKSENFSFAVRPLEEVTLRGASKL